MTKQMIEVDIPDGYEFVRYGIPVHGDYYMALLNSVPTLATGDTYSYFENRIIIKKKQPERIIFEKSFEKRTAKQGDFVMYPDGDILMWTLSVKSQSKYYILTKVEE